MLKGIKSAPICGCVGFYGPLQHSAKRHALKWVWHEGILPAQQCS
jgi:hypothetical protein